MSTQNRQWILNTRPSVRLSGEEFRWNEAPVPQPSDGQVLVGNLWLSVDPAQRTWMARDSYKPPVPLGDVMQSFAVGQVLESRHPDFKPGDLCPDGIDVFFDNPITPSGGGRQWLPNPRSSETKRWRMPSIKQASRDV